MNKTARFSRQQNLRERSEACGCDFVDEDRRNLVWSVFETTRCLDAQVRRALENVRSNWLRGSRWSQSTWKTSGFLRCVAPATASSDRAGTLSPVR